MPLLYFKKRIIAEVIAEILGYDPYWNNVTLLLHMNNSFMDEKGHTVSPTGNTVSSASFSKFGGYSTFFDGTTDYLTVSNPTADLALGTDNFTIEFWVYPTVFSAYGCMYDSRTINTNGSGFYIRQQGNTSGAWEISNGTNTLSTPSSVNLTLNTWQHIAVVRVGNSFNLYLNGVNVGQKTLSLSLSDATVRLGSAIDGYGFQGFMDEVRITKGIARYTANFTVPSAAFPGAIELEYDWFWDKTVLEIKGGNSGLVNDTLKDISTNNLQLTKVGNVVQGTIGPLTDTGSIYFDGNGDYVQVPDSTALSLASGDFTLETWVKRSGKNATYSRYPRIINGSNTWMTNSSWCLTAGHYDWGWDKFGFHVYAHNGNSTQMLQSTTIIADNVWYHIAVTRSGSEFRMFVNGVQEAGATWAGSMNTGTTNTARIGGVAYGVGDDFFNGKLSDLRVVKGTALYTSNFTVPSEPLTAIPNTTLLLKTENTGILDNSTFIDSSANDVTVYRTGNVSQGTVSPFTTGGSAYFPGVFEKLTFPASSNFAFGTGDFTIECWIKPHAFTNYITFVSTRTGLNTSCWSLGTQSSGQLVFYAGSELLRASAGSSGQLVLNTWHHVAIVRSNGILSGYCNGVKFAADVANNYNFTSTSFAVGSDVTYGEYTTGYMSNVRIVKGAAVYTSNFTVPTSPLNEITNTAILLKCEAASIVDDTRKNIIVAHGNVETNITTKKTGVASVYFDGNGDFLSFANKSEYAFGTGAFTIEFWINGALQSDVFIFGGRSAFGTMHITTGASATSSTPGCLRYVGSSTITSGSKVITDGNWHHCSITRNGTSNVKVFVDGILYGSGTDTTNYTVTTGSFIIGAQDYPGSFGASAYLNGYLDDFRITKGVARYTTAYSPKTTEVSSRLPTGGELLPTEYDPYWQQVVLSMPMESLVDIKGHTVTSIGTPGLDASVKKFGAASVSFNSNSYLTLSSSTDFQFGLDDFTIEAWSRLSAPTGGYAVIITCGPIQIRYGDAGYGYLLQANISANNVVLNSSATASGLTGQWVHTAIVRRTGIAYFYVNGSMVAASASAVNFPAASVSIGAWSDGQGKFVNSNIDDVRITKGIARYTSNFTVPTSANITNGAAF